MEGALYMCHWPGPTSASYCKTVEYQIGAVCSRQDELVAQS